MNECYTIKELAEVLSCSLPVARKKVEMNDFISTSKRLHGRQIKAYYINTSTLSELIKEVEENKRIYSKDSDNCQDSTSESFDEEEEILQQDYDNTQEGYFDQSHVVEIMREFSEQLRSTYESHQNRLDEVHRKLFMLGDSESRTQREYIEMQAKVSTLESTVEMLQQENAILKSQNDKLINLKWWQRKPL